MNRIPNHYVPAAGGPFRVLRGPHWNLLDEPSKRAFTATTFRVTPQADRMGLRLAGEPLRFVQPVECISAGVTTGTIQLPPEGQPIVLLADRQTTGGYPRLGEIISADLDRLAQLRPGDDVTLTFCSMNEARDASRAAASTLQKIREWTR